MIDTSASVAPYFPKIDSQIALLDPTKLPEVPEKVGPIFDSAHANTPIQPYDENTNQSHYGKEHPEFEPNLSPTTPDILPGDYLAPSLTKNERIRLTLFWYYTRHVIDDKEFVARLQDRLNLVQQFMGWEFAIIGLLGEHVFSRVATAGLPLAILPRRESTCSHTINQPSGSVFMLPNMETDWRFKHSPHVEQGGLRSYAGTHLRCQAEDGIDFAIGSLCVASNTPQEPLSPAQQTALVRFADIISVDIITRSRESRKQQRLHMSDLLAKVQSQATPENVELLVREIIAEIYPRAVMSLREPADHSLTVPGRSKPIPLHDIYNGLWEDSELIDKIIVEQNHEKLHTSATVRGIFFTCLTQPRTKYLLITTDEIQYVFDDVDAWFIERCALMICSTIQEGRLREALEAKDRFLRGITHQLRTPIHGVLGSVDLLAEELASRNLLMDDDTSYDNAADNSHTASSYLKTIRDSGRELMSTVNNMLKLNRWAENPGTAQPATLQSLNQVEADILHDVTQTIPDRELSQISLMFENQLATDYSMIVIDLVLLRECIQALIVNALQYTRKGAVIVTISGCEDYSRLRFDIVDTGIGIKPIDQARIFEPYEKVDPHTRGAGLGLTLATKIAAALNGEVSLVRSEPDYGSLFRAEFHDPGFACPINRKEMHPPSFDAVPKKFHIIPADTERPDLVLHFGSYLTHRGFEDAKSPDGAFIIITYTPDLDEFRRLVASVDPKQVAMTLIPAGVKTEKTFGKHEVRCFTGPFLTSRLEVILQELEKIYQRLNSSPEAGETASGTCDKTSSVRADEPADDVVSPSGSQPRALIVDDNAVNLRIMRMYCQKRDIPYVTATDGRQAVEAFQTSIDRNEPLNLVLMDLQMPVCDGIDATREIRGLEEKCALQACAIFMVTGQDSATDKQRSFAAGASEYYVKPMGIKTLDRAVGGYFPGFHRELLAP
ncbi:hypothetical protein AAFC00_002347 [Neodothiora populina]|uniref:histidine kinase n=1 Tax=Neodothiora populina TaxID=2781224 RepID=A0ABR3PH69_9PEZI